MFWWCSAVHVRLSVLVMSSWLGSVWVVGVVGVDVRLLVLVVLPY